MSLLDERPKPSTRLPVWQMAAGLFLVLWNAIGLAFSIFAQTGSIPQMAPEDDAYFAAQPLWFILFADLAPLSGVAGALAILLQHRSAVWLMAAQVIIILLANLYELAAGTSLLFGDDAPLSETILAYANLLAQYAFARWLYRNGRIF